MKKFFKILRKIFKTLLKIILWSILWIIIIVTIGLVIINNKTLKFYEFYDENHDFHRKFTMDKSFFVEDWYEVILNLGNWIITQNEIYDWEIDSKDIIKINLKNWIITADSINFEDSEIPWWYLNSHSTIKLKKLNLKNIKQWYKNWNVENFFDILEYFVDWEEIEYHDNWQISNKINYVNWLENWPYILYYKNGQIKEEWNYINWNKDWYRVSYYQNWNIYNEWNYKDWLENWVFTWYFEDWNIKFVYKFKDWFFDWNSVYYRDDGLYADIKVNNWVWAVTVYNKNNDIMSEYWFITDVNCLILNWKYIIYFEDWKITELNYKNWRYDWNQIWFYPDNSIMFSWNFKNGLWIMSYFDEKWNLIWTWEIEFNNQFEYWYLVNRYKPKTKNWLEISLFNNWQIKEISNYSGWILNWTQKIYYENWNIRYLWEHKIEKVWDRFINEPNSIVLSKFEYFDKNWNLIWTWEEFCFQRSWDLCTETKQMWNMIIWWTEPSWNTEIYEDIDWFRIIKNRISWYENWNLEYIQNYKNWKLENINHYYDNWQIKEEWIYTNWKKIWNRTWYYENWNIYNKWNYINWEQDLYRVRYYENWNIYSEWNYDNWKRVWVWNRYLWDWSIWVSKNYDE